MRNRHVEDPVHVLMALADRKASYRIAVQLQLRYLPGVVYSDILKDTSLIDTEKQLFPVYRLF